MVAGFCGFIAKKRISILAQGRFHSKSLCLLTQGEVGCLVFCVCCLDPRDCLFLVWFGRIGFLRGFWLGMGGDGFQTQKKSAGCRDRSGRKEFWQMRSQLTAERSGLASSVPRPMCGRGSVAGAVGTASLRACRESTSKRFTRRIKNGTLAHRLRVEEKSGTHRSQKRSRGCVRI